MLILIITSIICAVGELLILFAFRYKQSNRRKKVNRSLYKLMEERVLSQTLRSHITSEEAAAVEYRSPYLCVEFLDTKPWVAYVFALDEAITIGRSRDNKISIRDDKISRLHCKIVEMNQQLYLQDLGTANGTKIKRGLFRSIRLNPQETTTLRDKDKIMIGNYRMRIRLLYGYEAEI